MQHHYIRRSKIHYEKSPIIAAILGLFFGAFGLFYVRWYFGLAWIFPFMMIWSVVHNLFKSPAGLGIGLLVALIVSSVIGYFSAKGMNNQARGMSSYEWA